MVDKINISNVGNLNNVNKSNKTNKIPKGTDYDKLINDKSTKAVDGKGRIEVNKVKIDQGFTSNNFDPVKTFKEIEKYKEVVKNASQTDRLAKLDRIRRSIDDGSYQIDAFKVADKILKSGFFS
ncbi:flagellar biosynthesis anti-sigma factor FlgM [bacterium]|nr:flagellar biosynthesis anti-sigma factor FlgM [bacterium]